MRKVGIIQAHCKSFAGGESVAVREFDGTFVVEKVIERLKKVKELDEIVLAVPDVVENKIFEQIAEKHGVSCFKGDKDDVAARLLNCAEKFNADIIVHVFGNYIIFNINQIEEMLNLIMRNKLDAVFFTQEVFLGGGTVFNVNSLKDIKYKLEQGQIEETFIVRPLAYLRTHAQEYNTKGIKPILPEEQEVKEAKEILSQVLNSGGVSEADIKGADERDLGIGRYKFASQYVSSHHVILDVACAYGVGTHLLSNYSSKAIGVDIASYAVEKAKFLYKKENVEFYVGDATHLDFIPNESCDVVVSFETIEHIEDDNAFVKEINRVLKPGGLLVISTPRKAGDIIINPYHVREYTFNQLENVLNNGGFQPEEQYSYTNYVISEGEDGEGFIWVCKKILSEILC